MLEVLQSSLASYEAPTENPVCVLSFFSLFFISTNKFLLLNFATVVFFSLQAYLDLRKCMYSVPLCSYASFQRQRVVIIL